MKAYVLQVILLLTTTISVAQDRVLKLVEAEKSFARYAYEHNTRDAFLRFMDSNAVVFDSGKVIQAMPLWQARTPASSKLIWDPSFAVISTAGDLGFTSGPWTFRASARDTVIASGEFTTVWQYRNNEWKWLVDMGVTHNKRSTQVMAAAIELSHVERTTYDARRFMLAAEQQLIQQLASEGKSAYNAIADPDIYLVNPGQLPVHGVAQIDQALTQMSGAVQFQAVNSGISKDGDIGYVYGYANEKNQKGNYLRVWRRIGRRWSLILQTLTI